MIRAAFRGTFRRVATCPLSHRAAVLLLRSYECFLRDLFNPAKGAVLKVSSNKPRLLLAFVGILLI